jgi:hypothetical protein
MAEYYVLNRDDKQRSWMNGAILWWCANGNGYTSDLDLAGIFTDADKERGYPCPKNCVYVPVEAAREQGKTVRLVWWRDLAALFIEPQQPGAPGAEVARG